MDVDVMQISSEVRLFSQNNEVISVALVSLWCSRHSRDPVMILTREQLNEAWEAAELRLVCQRRGGRLKYSTYEEEVVSSRYI